MVKLEVTIEELHVILVALSKLPYEVVSSVIEKLKTQAQPQVSAKDPE